MTALVLQLEVMPRGGRGKLPTESLRRLCSWL